jgi:hypothetical protein
MENCRETLMLFPANRLFLATGDRQLATSTEKHMFEQMFTIPASFSATLFLSHPLPYLSTKDYGLTTID